MDYLPKQIIQNVVGRVFNSSASSFAGIFLGWASTINALMFQIGAKDTDDSSIFYGSCLPKTCPPNTLQQDVAQIPLHVKSIDNHISEYQHPYNLPFFITFLIFSVIITLVSIATLSSKIKEHKILSSFSLQSTTKVFKYSQNSRLNVLNGIKSVSMFWVIYGHTMSMSIGYSLNIPSVQGILNDWKFLTVQAGLYSVDTFFFVGGFLLAYSFLKEKSVSNKKYLLAILNRFLRFLPAYFVAIMIYFSIFPHLGSGPFWQNQLKNSNLCHSLWRPLLFVDNLVQNGDNMCMGWGWYLQNDMQLFILCILVIFLYQKKKIYGYLAMSLLILGNFVYVMLETYLFKEEWLNRISDPESMQRYQLNVYFKPWSRCPPYIYGLLLGILYNQYLQYEQKLTSVQKGKISLLNQSKVVQNEPQQINNIVKDQPIPFLFKIKQFFSSNPWKRRLVQLSGVCICLFICFIPRTNQGNMYWPQIIHSIYLTFGKILFVFGLSLLIIPSIILPTNSKSKLLVRFILDTKLFSYIAKVSYCTYLIHLTLLLLYFGSFKFDFYYAMGPTFTIFVSFSVLSLFCGLILFLLVEQPFSHLQRQLMKKLLRSKKSQNKLKEELIQEENQKGFEDKKGDREVKIKQNIMAQQK